MAKFQNISNGPRGAYLGTALIMAEVGQVIEADDVNEEWFAPAKAEKVEAKAPAKADDAK